MKTIIQELLGFCGVLQKESRLAGDHAGMLDSAALAEIGTDLDRERVECGALAFSARVSDDEGISRLRDALKDGKVTADEIPMLRTALKHFENSRRSEQALIERLS